MKNGIERQAFNFFRLHKFLRNDNKGIEYGSNSTRVEPKAVSIPQKER